MNQMFDHVKPLVLCTLLIGCSVWLPGCSSDEPVIVGGPTQEILDWQAKNRAEFAKDMQEQTGK